MDKKIYSFDVRAYIRSVDGDTHVFLLDLGLHTYMEEHVRLIDVDTPEKYGVKAEPDRARAAQAFAESWLRAALWLRVISDRYDQREKYGRILGRVFRDDDPVTLGGALTAAGHVKLP